MTNSLWARVSTMMGSSVDWEIRLAVKNTISSAGSARNETSISRRAPRLPKEVPMSIAARARKTRARAKMPTRAITSAAGENGSNEYVFYDGPPFANGLPHYGHLLTGYAKDLFPRYQTMRGKRVEG